LVAALAAAVAGAAAAEEQIGVPRKLEVQLVAVDTRRCCAWHGFAPKMGTVACNRMMEVPLPVIEVPGSCSADTVVEVAVVACTNLAEEVDHAIEGPEPVEDTFLEEFEE
jgi:hypothetical protein